MAVEKKSFILYSDLITTVEKLVIKDREQKTNYAGELFLHVLQYVNDQNPIPVDFIIEIAFDPIKKQLKRDLEKYEEIKEEKSINGRVGNLKRWNNDLYILYKTDKITLEDAEEKALYRKTSLSDNSDRMATKPIAKIADNDNDNVNDIKYKYTLFSQIKDLPDALNSFEGDKRYFFIAYKFWALWKHENPNHKTLINAKIDNWYNEVRKMVEIDKTSIDRILAVYAYFSKYEQKGFRRFWFDTIQSVAALRGKNKNGEYTLDKIAIEINAKTAEDTEFYQYIQSIIKKFNNNESLKSPKKAV